MAKGKGVSLDTGVLQKIVVGLVLAYIAFTFLGEIANPIADSITNVTGSNLQGAALFKVTGIVLLGGILILIVKAFMGGRR